jgi:hypothetical protein
MLVAQEYLRLGDPPMLSRDIKMGEAAEAVTRATAVEWSQTMLAAHLASTAIRLASIDHVLKTAKEARALYLACREYFRAKSCLADDARGHTCSQWFHVMLRDAVAHNEPRRGAPDKQNQRYQARQRCVEATTYDEAHDRLKQIAGELLEVLAAQGIVLPGAGG